LIKVLFTGGGGAGNEALWRLLNNRYELHFADADRNNINTIIPENRRHNIPLANDEDFIFQINTLCKIYDIDLIVPGVDEELILLAKYCRANNVEILLPDIDYIETMLDKYIMNQVLADKGINVPLTGLLSQGLNWECPCIVKPRNGRGARGFRIINECGELVKLWEDTEHTENIVIQQKIEGTEYTVQMIADSYGSLKAIVPVKIDIKKGITIRAETDNNPQVIEACKKIHEAIPTKGCYNIQLILTKDGEVYPFEINPRISTTFCMTVAAGIDPIDIFLNGNDSKKLLPFNKIKLQRHWTNYFTECL
jgi:carbamoyl-phosphate synthase large subunit